MWWQCLWCLLLLLLFQLSWLNQSTIWDNCHCQEPAKCTKCLCERSRMAVGCWCLSPRTAAVDLQQPPLQISASADVSACCGDRLKGVWACHLPGPKGAITRDRYFNGAHHHGTHLSWLPVPGLWWLVPNSQRSNGCSCWLMLPGQILIWLSLPWTTGPMRDDGPCEGHPAMGPCGSSNPGGANGEDELLHWPTMFHQLPLLLQPSMLCQLQEVQILGMAIRRFPGSSTLWGNWGQTRRSQTNSSWGGR